VRSYTTRRFIGKLADPGQAKLALAAYFVALARTLGGQHVRFDANLERVYREMEDFQHEPLGALEALRWGHELLREKS
jgi:hypothetical protein